MNEYFVVANSRAAPFFSDKSEQFVIGEDPHKTIAEFANNYSHPAGLFSARLYANADSYHKNQEPLASWYSPEAYSQVSKAPSGGIIV